MSAQDWNRPPAPGYAYGPARPPAGYYAYPGQPQAVSPPPVDYQHHYEPHGESYGYNPYAYAPPPQQQPGYYPAPPFQQQPAPEPEILSYNFVRAEHKGWHVFDPHGALVFDVTYKKAGLFEHPGCEVHHGTGGPVLVTVYDEVLTAGAFTSKIKRSSHHDGKMSFDDPHSHSYGFRETKDWDLLLVYPSKETIAQGNVDINSGKGVLKIMDRQLAPDAPLLVAAYVELLRKQKSDQEDAQSAQWGAIGAIAAGN